MLLFPRWAAWWRCCCLHQYGAGGGWGDVCVGGNLEIEASRPVTSEGQWGGADGVDAAGAGIGPVLLLLMPERQLRIPPPRPKGQPGLVLAGGSDLSPRGRGPRL